ncbi:unnamed protein product, partial [Musa banksii]
CILPHLKRPRGYSWYLGSPLDGVRPACHRPGFRSRDRQLRRSPSPAVRPGHRLRRWRRPAVRGQTRARPLPQGLRLHSRPDRATPWLLPFLCSLFPFSTALPSAASRRPSYPLHLSPPPPPPTADHSSQAHFVRGRRHSGYLPQPAQPWHRLPPSTSASAFCRRGGGVPPPAAAPPGGAGGPYCRPASDCVRDCTEGKVPFF